MGTIVFGGGAVVQVTGDAHNLMQSLSRTAGGQRASEHGRPLPAGFVDVHTADGVIYVNPLQVAYVYDEADMPEVEQAEGGITMPQGRIAP
jgi:hypothetical protein